MPFTIEHFASTRVTSPSIRARWGVATVLALGSAYILRDNTAQPAIEWMLQYHPRDFTTWSDLAALLCQLRSGIPPPLAVLEVSSQILFGSMALVTTYAYRAGFTLAFLLPSTVFARSRLQLAISATTCFAFLWGASEIVKQNAQSYDIYFPLAILLALTCVRQATRAATSSGAALWAACAGVATSMMELLRPFGLFLVPILLLHTWMAWQGKRSARLVAFLLPLAVLSGGWHLKLIVNHGQVIWSNHGGINLYRAWQPLLEKDSGAPPPRAWLANGTSEEQSLDFVGSGALAALRLDSRTHSELAAERARVVMNYFVNHPIQSALHVAIGMRDLFAPQIVVHRMGSRSRIEARTPRSPIIPIYRAAVWVTAGFALLNAALLVIWIGRHRSLEIFAHPEAVILTLATLSVGAFAVGERGEEARFLVSVLPLLGAYASILVPVRTANGRTWKLAWLWTRTPEGTAPLRALRHDFVSETAVRAGKARKRRQRA